VQLAAPPRQLGVATTAVRFVQTLGGAFGAAVFGTILARASAGHSIVHGVDTVFRWAAGVMVLALVLAALVPSRDRSAGAEPGVAVRPGPDDVGERRDGGVDVRV